MAAPIYRWKHVPHGLSKYDAQIVGEELEKIRLRYNGRLDQENVVREATEDQSPLHDMFEWRDDVAAVEWRKEQARNIIRHITVLIPKGDDQESVPLRAFVSVSQDSDEPGYTSVTAALSDPTMRNVMIRRAFRELEQWRERYDELLEFAKLFSAMEEIRKKLR